MEQNTEQKNIGRDDFMPKKLKFAVFGFFWIIFTLFVILIIKVDIKAILLILFFAVTAFAVWVGGITIKMIEVKVFWKRFFLGILLFISSVLIFGFIIESNSPSTSARDPRIISDLAQLRTQAELSNEEYGSYVKVNCNMSADATALCTDISKQLGSTYPTDAPVFATTITGDNYCAYDRLKTKFGGQQDYYCITRTMSCKSINTNTACVPGATPLVGCGACR